MDVIVIESSAFVKVLEEVRQYLKAEGEKEDDKNVWLSEEQAGLIIGKTSKSSWQKIRNKGEVIFSLDGTKIRYNKASVLAYLWKKVPARALQRARLETPHILPKI
jgi:hypothetical protein